MRKLRQLAILIFFSVITFSATAQDAEPADTIKKWDLGGIFNLNMNQVSLYNWTAGGVNSVSGGVFFDLHANYKYDKMGWANTLKVGYGLIEQEGLKTQKTDDFIEFNSDLNREAFAKNWFYAVNLNFKTQFSQGYSDPNVQEVVISDFMSPAYLVSSAGLNYKPNDVFKAHLAPISSKITIVNKDSLANAGAYGVEAAVVDDNGVIVTPGQNVRYQWGAFARLEFQKEVVTNVSIRSKMDLFMDYENPASIDVNWEVLMDFKINKFLSTSLNFYTIYDDDIAVPLEEDAAGNVTKSGPRVQLKQVLGLGINVKI